MCRGLALPCCTAIERHYLHELTAKGSWWGPGLWRMARVTPWCSGWTMTSVWKTPASWCALLWSHVLLPVLPFGGIENSLSEIASTCWPAVQSEVPTVGSQRAKHALQNSSAEQQTKLYRLDSCQFHDAVGIAPTSASCLHRPGFHITH